MVHDGVFGIIAYPNFVTMFICELLAQKQLIN